MLCGGNLSTDDGGSELVHLNVYDLTPINGYAYWVGLGVYHSGVQVHGVEYAFGAHEFPTTGIFETKPKQCEGFSFRKTILIGKTDMGPSEVRAAMEKLAEEYRGNAYNLITKNCNHFCNDACVLLTRNPIPNWVNRLARIGFLCNCVLPENLYTTKVKVRRVEEKPHEEDKKKLTSKLEKHVSNSNSSSSSSSSPCEVASTPIKAVSPSPARGRSRTRRARPPSSPLIPSSSPSS